MAQKYHTPFNGFKTRQRILVKGRWLTLQDAKDQAALIVSQASKDALEARIARLRAILD